MAGGSLGPDRIVLPSGTTTTRPSSPAPGTMLWNTTLGNVEVWTGDMWITLGNVVNAGMHYYNINNTTSGVDYYQLSAPFDLDSKGSSLYNLLSGTRVDCIDISNDGTKFFALGDSGTATDVIMEYSLTIPFDLSTASHVRNVTLWYDGAPPVSLEFADRGNKLYTTDNSIIQQFNLPNPYDISGLGPSSTPDATLTDGWPPFGPGEPAFNPQGTLMTVGVRSDTDIKTFQLSTPWDISTATKIASYNAQAGSGDQDPSCGKWNGDGTKLFVRHASPDMVNEYSTTTPYSVSGMSYTRQVYNNSGFAGGGHEFNYRY